VVRPTYSYFGRFYIYDSVVMQIAQRVALEVPGVKRVLKTLVLTVSDGATLDVELVLERGAKVFQVMAAVQRRLKDRIEYLTGIYLQRVDVTTKKIGLE
ncbi:MAG TPA: Asp23/Gls24 family envelope stress response protein, partial [Firmicutes bacterium]|nr:Asp23/Gls24 family envelope stress response protein [Candidatus Fermentithermobacillaceae bacterium]